MHTLQITRICVTPGILRYLAQGSLPVSSIAGLASVSNYIFNEKNSLHMLCFTIVTSYMNVKNFKDESNLFLTLFHKSLNGTQTLFKVKCYMNVSKSSPNGG